MSCESPWNIENRIICPIHPSCQRPSAGLARIDRCVPCVLVANVTLQERLVGPKCPGWNWCRAAVACVLSTHMYGIKGEEHISLREQALIETITINHIMWIHPSTSRVYWSWRANNDHSLINMGQLRSFEIRSVGLEFDGVHVPLVESMAPLLVVLSTFWQELFVKWRRVKLNWRACLLLSSTLSSFISGLLPPVLRFSLAPPRFVP